MAARERIKTVTIDEALNKLATQQASLLNYHYDLLDRIGACSTKREVNIILAGHYAKELERERAVKKATQSFKDGRKLRAKNIN